MPSLWAETVEHEPLHSLRLPVSAFVELEVERLGTTSVAYACRIVSERAVAVTGSHTAVHVEYVGRVHPVPDNIREALPIRTSASDESVPTSWLYGCIPP